LRIGFPRILDSTLTPDEDGAMGKLPLQTRVEKLTALLEVGKAMASERNLDRLLQLILGEVTKVMGAERSSLFLVDRERNELWSKIAQGLEVREIRINIGMGISGYVAQTGKILNIHDAYADPRFNQETDQRTGYRTRTILCAPMLNKPNEVIGVLQVLNKLDGVFTAEDEELLLALSSQAAVAVENAILYEDIQKLFEGFIKASVYAIESRDPTTSGHSERVAILTVGLAEQVNRYDSGPYATVSFSPDDIRELRFASLLHDFGKVAVREPVLVKANKLYDHDLDLVVSRFKLIKQRLENDALQKKLGLAMSRGPGSEASLAEVDAEFQRQLAEVDAQLHFILEANKPTVLPRGGFERILEISANTFMDVDGNRVPFLTARESESLSIAKGSLTVDERLQIQSHVTHSFRFLRQIPWTKDLRRIPPVAYAHHEKLDGTGYPSGLRGDDIPFQAKMMAICDIYDAITASDRPYRRAMPPERALEILGFEVKNGLVDAELVRLFAEGKVWALTAGLRTGTA
jgi:HD-GYP domain-containing protein (c-di-GMP phosphodiesterase class II)